VDVLSPSAGVHVVNDFTTGEWLSFTIYVSQEGTYRLEALVSSAYSRSRLRIEVDGLDRTGTLAVANTGSWTTFQWVGSGGVSLTAGEHVLKIHAQAEYFNLDAIRLTLETAPATSARPRAARR
jgi:hypothetical protein